MPTNPDKNSIKELGRVGYILITLAQVLTTYGLAFNLVSVLGFPED